MEAKTLQTGRVGLETGQLTACHVLQVKINFAERSVGFRCTMGKLSKFTARRYYMIVCPWLSRGRQAVAEPSYATSYPAKGFPAVPRDGAASPRPSVSRASRLRAKPLLYSGRFRRRTNSTPVDPLSCGPTTPRKVSFRSSYARRPLATGIGDHRKGPLQDGDEPPPAAHRRRPRWLLWPGER